MYQFKISNIKLSLKLSRVCLDSVQNVLLKKKCVKGVEIIVKKYQNFLVIKNVFTYILFKSGDKQFNHLNITSVSSYEKIDSACDHLLNNLLEELNVKEIFRRIDNISATFNANKKIELLDIISFFNSSCEISYNSEKFPGAFLKFKIGTIIVFHTGKCVFIGCKNLSNLKCLEKNILKYVNTKIN